MLYGIESVKQLLAEQEFSNTCPMASWMKKTLELLLKQQLLCADTENKNLLAIMSGREHRQEPRTVEMSILPWYLDPVNYRSLSAFEFSDSTYFSTMCNNENPR